MEGLWRGILGEFDVWRFGGYSEVEVIVIEVKAGRAGGGGRPISVCRAQPG